jgi:hypothetical protein
MRELSRIPPLLLTALFYLTGFCHSNTYNPAHLYSVNKKGEMAFINRVGKNFSNWNLVIRIGYSLSSKRKQFDKFQH